MNNIDKKRYPNQPLNEIWFYDKEKPYYWLTNFYSSPITTKLPIEPFRLIKRNGDKEMLDEKGRMPKEWEHFFHSDFKNWAASKDFVIRSKKGEGKEIAWPSSEHLFQAMKFTDWWNVPSELVGDHGMFGGGVIGIATANANSLAVVIEKISEASGSREAYNYAKNNFKKGGRKDWIKKTSYNDDGDIEEVPMRLRAMRFAVREKFAQNSELKEKLWQTGTKKLVEHSPVDNFWGDGADGKGENWLGKILTEIRQEIIAERGECPNPTEEYETSSTEKPKPTTDEGEEVPPPKESETEKGDDETRKDTKDKPKPTPPPPTQEEVNNLNDNLKNSENNAEDLKNALDEAKKKEEKISDEAQRQELKKNIKEAENKLAQKDKKMFAESIKNNLENKLKENGVKLAELTSECLTKYQELNNDNVEPSRSKEIEKEFLNELGVKSLDKLITEIKQALKSADKKQIVNQIELLKQFINSSMDYKQNAYQKQKNTVQQLIKEGENKIKNLENQSNPPSYGKIVLIGAAIFSVVILTLILIRKKRKKNKKSAK